MDLSRKPPGLRQEHKEATWLEKPESGRVVGDELREVVGIR